MNRRLIAFLVLLFAVYVAGWVTGVRANGPSEDGPRWRNVSAEGRLLYVYGYDSGFRQGSFNTFDLFQDRLTGVVIKKQITPEGAKELRSAKEEEPSQDDPWTIKMRWSGWTATKITDGQIKEGIDRFYANPANQAICWRTRLWSLSTR
jgi:hypothetical protein